MKHCRRDGEAGARSPGEGYTVAMPGAETVTRSSPPSPSSAASPSLAGALAAIDLPDADRGLVRLGGLWAERPAVVVFLRHYG